MRFWQKRIALSSSLSGGWKSCRVMQRQGVVKMSHHATSFKGHLPPGPRGRAFKLATTWTQKLYLRDLKTSSNSKWLVTSFKRPKNHPWKSFTSTAWMRRLKTWNKGRKIYCGWWGSINCSSKVWRGKRWCCPKWDLRRYKCRPKWRNL